MRRLGEVALAAGAGAWIVAASAAFAVIVPACADLHRANGDTCVKSDDCLSNSCSGQMCVNASFDLDDAQLQAPLTDADLALFAAPGVQGEYDAGSATDAADAATEVD